MKYLGLHLDGKWTFEEHFAQVAPRIGGIASSLARLLPNLGGPDGRIRKLYVDTVGSVALYGTDLGGCCLGIQQDQGRTAGGTPPHSFKDRAVAYAAVMVLAGSPPLELLA
ncbi:uncharacterized protein LOC112639685 [Camponotus floridanus]|uniref:uncharacterized protein LOC112639685 n=1 Tax=Camponotus floridanus TaxID=104421 RepID=UPI000DC686DA|nr:uncharacterized protein LOC112639685 [Camponotus floridanus]